VGSRPIVCELFAGVGGLTLGAVRAGFDVRVAVELDVRAARAHLRNFPKSVVLQKDVSTLVAADLFSAAKVSQGGIDGIIGGPPCQGFSTIGRRHPNDVRNNLFAHFFRLVAEVQPKFFVAENVPGILEARFASDVEAAIAPVRDKYRIIGPLTLKASDFGAPTSRTRVVFIGFRTTGTDSQTSSPSFLLAPNGEPVVVQAALRGLPREAPDWRDVPGGRVRLHSVRETPFLKKVMDARPPGVGDVDVCRLLERGIVLGHQGTVHSEELLRRYEALNPGQQDPITKSVRLIANGFCPTLRAGTGPERGSFQAVRPIHFNKPRVITPREAARLQSFPDWFVFDQTKWHSFRQIGNSVPPLLAEAFLLEVMHCLAHTRTAKLRAKNQSAFGSD